MSLDYDKIRAEEESPQTSMSAYSDLFAALAFVFLFLYVISTLQLNLQAISSNIETRKLEAKIQQYESSEQTAPGELASRAVQPEDDEILRKLADLEMQTREEARKLFEQAQALQQYEQQLINRYQDVVALVQRKNEDLTQSLQEQKTEAETRQAELERSAQQIQELEIAKEQVAAEKEELAAEQEKLQQELAANRQQIEGGRQHAGV